jgi:hypothetical protein
MRGRSGNSLEAQQKRDARLNVKENRREKSPGTDRLLFRALLCFP